MIHLQKVTMTKVLSFNSENAKIKTCSHNNAVREHHEYNVKKKC